MLEFAKKIGIKKIILETPSVATQSHKFYEKAGFLKTSKYCMDIPYKCPHEDSYIYT